MQLNPRQPPGRITRKARGYSAEILRLRAEGYTLEAIRLALLDAGISVTVTTVRREANRLPIRLDETPADASLPALAEQPAEALAAPVATSPAPSSAAHSRPPLDVQDSSAINSEPDLARRPKATRTRADQRLAEAIATAFFSRIGRPK